MILNDNMVKSTKSEILSFAESFNDDPHSLSGWGHNYFCEDDGGRLQFDLNRPEEHQCSACGRVYTTEKYNKTWVYLYRYMAIEICYKAAVLNSEERSPELIKVVTDILSFYAKNYDTFEKHAKDKVNPIENGVTGFGKIMPQGLNEAMMLINIIHTLILVEDELNVTQKELFKNFVNEITVFLFDQRMAYHNIICWIDSAIGSAGLYLNNEEYLDSAINSKYGLNNQLKNGLTPDGFWYEGSIHYHFFTAEGILNFLLIAEIYGKELGGIKETMKKMLTSPYYLSFSTMVFPNPNDGWPGINIKTYSHLYYMGYRIFNDDEINYIVKRIDTSAIERTPLPLSEPFSIGGHCISKILYPRAQRVFSTLYDNDKTTHFENSGFSMLKSKNINVFIKYGYKTRSHAHPDLLNIEFSMKDQLISRDLSNPGYGSDLYDNWYGKTISHSTVSIGGLDQSYTEKSVIESKSENSLTATVNDAFTDTVLSRTITVEDDSFRDNYMVKTGSDQSIDYILHMDAQLETELESETATIGYSENGYQYLQDIKKVKVNEDRILLKWSSGSISFNTDIDLKDKELYLCKSYDNPSSTLRSTIILRTYGREMQSSISFSIN